MADGRFALNPRIIIKGLVLIATLSAVGYALKVLDFDALFGTDWVDRQVRGHGLTGQALFVAAGWIMTAVGIPRHFVAFLAGYAFGFALGLPLALLATVLGCATTLFYARLMGRSYVQRKFPNRVRRADAFFADNTFTMTLLIRLLPVGNNTITNLVAGVSSASAGLYVLGSALGYIPQSAVFVLVGSGINVDPTLRIGMGAALFVVSAVLGVFLYRRFRGGRTFDDRIEQSLGDVPVPGNESAARE